MRLNTTRMSSTLTKQINPMPNAITTNLVKAQPNSTFVRNLFQSDVVELERLVMQNNTCNECKRRGE
jgi:hypothetical protein